MRLEPRMPGSPAFVPAGRRVRCDRCGKVHVLVLSDEPDDDSGALYVDCHSRRMHAAHKHWLTGSSPAMGNTRSASREPRVSSGG